MRTLLLLLFPIFLYSQESIIQYRDSMQRITYATIPPYTVYAITDTEDVIRDTTLIFGGIDTPHIHSYIRKDLLASSTLRFSVISSDVICTICLRNFTIQEYTIPKIDQYKYAKERLRRLLDHCTFEGTIIDIDKVIWYTD